MIALDCVWVSVYESDPTVLLSLDAISELGEVAV